MVFIAFKSHPWVLGDPAFKAFKTFRASGPL
jgi:hypothetical protein